MAAEAILGEPPVDSRASASSNKLVDAGVRRSDEGRVTSKSSRRESDVRVLTSVEFAKCSYKLKSSRRVGRWCVVRGEFRGRRQESGFFLWVSASSGLDRQR